MRNLLGISLPEVRALIHSLVILKGGKILRCNDNLPILTVEAPGLGRYVPTRM